MNLQENSIARDRFPGLRSFEREDQHTFFGRKTEMRQFANLVLNNRVSVVFGQSGVGKSSLINTVFLKEKDLADYLPVRIRLNQNFIEEAQRDESIGILPKEVTPLSKTVFLEIRRQLLSYGVTYNFSDIIFDKSSPCIWEFIKLAELSIRQKNKNGQLTLIFDQFEEFFAYHEDEQKSFLAELAEIAHERSPKRLLDWIGEIDYSNRNDLDLEWYRQPEVKIVFGIRSDRLSFMNRMIGQIPKILTARLEIMSFDSENAREAIKEPCLLENNEGEFLSPKITIAPSVIEQIITSLQGKSNEIETSFLQIICSHIEQRVNALRPLGAEFLRKGEFIFDQVLYDKEVKIAAILDNFYENQLGKVKSDDQRKLIRRVIEDDLVSDGRRASLLDTQILEKLHDDEKLLTAMVQARLIRKEITSRGATYELSHDKLIEPVENSKKSRKQREKVEAARLEHDRLLVAALESEQEIKRQKELLQEKELLLAEKDVLRKQGKFWLKVLSVVCVLCLGLLGLCGYYFVKVSRNANREVLEQANESYHLNSHANAFINWNIYLDQPVFASKKDSIRTLLSDKFFFDISGGEGICQVSDSSFVVRNASGSLILWNFNKSLDRLHAQKFVNTRGKAITTTSFLVSENKRYIAYRNMADGEVYVYNQASKKAVRIPGSKLDFSVNQNKKAGKKVSNIQQLKMDFLQNNRYLSYLDSLGNMNLFDAESGHKLLLTILKRKDVFQTSDLKKICLISEDNKYLALKRPSSDSLKVYTLNGKNKPKLSGYLLGVENALYSFDKRSLLIRFKNKNLCAMSFAKMSCDTLVRNATEVISSPDGSKALVLQNSKDLFVYDFLHKTKLESKKLLKRFWDGKGVLKLSNIVRWIGNSNKFSFKNRQGYVFVIDLSDVSSHFLGDYNKMQNTLNTSENFNYILSKDGSRGAYINKKGIIVVVDIPSSKIIYSTQVTKNTDIVFSLSYTLENLISLSENGREVAFVQNFDVGENELRVVDVSSGKLLYHNSIFRYIGKVFTNKFISLVFDDNSEGGIFFFNDQKRDLDYYKKLFPKETENIEVVN